MAQVENRRTTALDEWRSRFAAVPLRDAELFTSISGAEVDPLPTPETVTLDYERDLGYPGSFPFTRGVYTSMQPARQDVVHHFTVPLSAATTGVRQGTCSMSMPSCAP